MVASDSAGQRVYEVLRMLVAALLMDEVYVISVCSLYRCLSWKAMHKEATDALFSPQASDCSEGHFETASENNEDVNPTLIWSCVYVQEITEVHFYLLLVRTVFMLVS